MAKSASASGDDVEKISEMEMAELIVDALFVAGILDQADVHRALQIATEELVSRRAMGNF